MSRLPSTPPLVHPLRPDTRISFRLLLWLVVLGPLLALGDRVRAQPPGAQPPANVVVRRVEVQDVTPRQTLVGAIVPSRRSVVGSAVDGRVESLRVNDGDAVDMVEEQVDGRSERRLQVMVQLRTKTVSLEIAAAKAELETRQQQLAELKAGSRPEEIAEAKARLAAADALRTFAMKRLERVKLLAEGNTTSLEKLEEAQSEALAAEQNHLAAKASYDLVVEGPRREQIKQAEARVQNQLEEVRRLEDVRTKYSIRAPFKGHVVAKHTEVGEWLSRGDPVAEVVALDPAEIEVAVPETYIPHVLVGDTAEVKVDAFPGRSFRGEVARVVPQADLRSRSFPVKIRLENPVNDQGRFLLKAGMLARVTLVVGPRTKGFMIPKDALILNQDQPPSIMVVGRNEKSQAIAVPVRVKVGVAKGPLILVEGDLREGQQVIVLGNERVRPQQPVNPVPATSG